MSLYRRGKTWWFEFRFCGQLIRESTKSTSVTVAREAERQRRQEMIESYNGVSKQRRSHMFNSAAAAWKRSRPADLAPKTIELYELALSHLRTSFGGKLLSDISADDIAEYQAKRTAEGAAGRTVNMETGVLRQIMRKYKMWGKVSDEVTTLKERRDIGRALTADQEAALLSAASDPRYRHSPLYVITVLALNTAMRSQEIKTLRWRQVDFKNSYLTVEKSKTEGGSGRGIPLNASALAVLEYWRGRSTDVLANGYVFPACEHNKVDRMRPIKSFRTAWRNATKTAGLPGLRFHDLRHTAITKLAETMASDQTIMAIAGHVSRKMLEHYSHIRIEAKRNALDAISQPVFPGTVSQNHTQSEKLGKSERLN